MSDTYRFVGDRDFYHEGETLAAGAEIELTDYAYRIHSDYFEPVDGDAGEGSDESDTADDGEEEAATDDLDDRSYSDLQSLAAEHDDIKGNLPEDDLRDALREKRDG